MPTAELPDESEMTMETELLREKTARLEGRRPFGTQEVEAMSQAVSPSGVGLFGLVRVARCWKVLRATLYRRIATVRHRPVRNAAPARGTMRRRHSAGPRQASDRMT